MVKFRSTIILALTSNFVVVPVAAFPHSYGTHHQRAVDVMALIPNEGRPQPPNPVQLEAERRVDLEIDSQKMKRAVNLEGYVPYLHDSSPPVDARSFDRQRAPFPHPVPQQQVKSGGGPMKNQNVVKRDSESTILANEGEKVVDVVPIVGRAVDPTVLENEKENPVDVVPIVGRAADPSVFQHEEELPVDVGPTVGRAVDLAAFTNDNRKSGEWIPNIARAVDVAALNEMVQTCGEGRKTYNPTKDL